MMTPEIKPSSNSAPASAPQMPADLNKVFDLKLSGQRIRNAIWCINKAQEGGFVKGPDAEAIFLELRALKMDFLMALAPKTPSKGQPFGAVKSKHGPALQPNKKR